MCNHLLHNFFFEKRENLGRSNEAKRSKTVENGEEPMGTKNYATPTNEDVGQPSNWSKLVAADLSVARPTILDRLVTFQTFCDRVILRLWQGQGQGL